MTTAVNYTIAYAADADLLIACEPNGSDRIAAVVAGHQADLAEIGLGALDVEYHDYVTLTDELSDGDELVYTSGERGRLIDQAGREFAYAVRRAA